VSLGKKLPSKLQNGLDRLAHYGNQEIASHSLRGPAFVYRPRVKRHGVRRVSLWSLLEKYFRHSRLVAMFIASATIAQAQTIRQNPQTGHPPFSRSAAIGPYRPITGSQRVKWFVSSTLGPQTLTVGLGRWYRPRRPE
jgi:hypothetical protein